MSLRETRRAAIWATEMTTIPSDLADDDPYAEIPVDAPEVCDRGDDE